MRIDSVDEVLWAIAKHAVAKLGYEDCIVYLKENNQLIQKAAFGPKNPQGYDITNPFVLKIGEGICGAVAASGKPELITDTSLDSRYIVDDTIRLSEITVPILYNNEVIGIIDSEHPEKNFFKEQDVEILETIASMASVKIAQATAQSEVLEHKKELENKVAESTSELHKTIKELKISNREIQQRNYEKETLLKEIHHRVKNNLQIVSSLLSLNSTKIVNEDAQAVFVDCQNKIKSMSLIHEQLYGREDLSKINAKKYIEEISEELANSYNSTDEIKIKCDLEEVYYGLDISVPLGLILNELIVNALKYAFPNGDGLISISLKKTNNEISLMVNDNGCGFNLKNVRDGSLGIELVETLTDQIDGQFTIKSSDEGTNCNLKFSV